MNNTSLAGTTIFAFETDPQSLKESYRHPSFFKSSLSHLESKREAEQSQPNECSSGMKRARLQSNSQQVAAQAEVRGDLQMTDHQATTMVVGKDDSRPLTQPQLSTDKKMPPSSSRRHHSVALSLQNPSSNRLKKQSTSTGFHRKLLPRRLQVIANLQIVNDLDKMEELLESSGDGLGSGQPIFGDKTTDQSIYEMVFPRLMFLDLEGSLIDAHLEIFR